MQRCLKLKKLFFSCSSPKIPNPWWSSKLPFPPTLELKARLNWSRKKSSTTANNKPINTNHTSPKSWSKRRISQLYGPNSNILALPAINNVLQCKNKRNFNRLLFYFFVFFLTCFDCSLCHLALCQVKRAHILAFITCLGSCCFWLANRLSIVSTEKFF